MNYDACPITRRQTISRGACWQHWQSERGMLNVWFLNTDEPWRNYGHEEPVIEDFICRYTETSLSVKTADITSDGGMFHHCSLHTTRWLGFIELVNESSITNYESLNEFTGIHLVSCFASILFTVISYTPPIRTPRKIPWGLCENIFSELFLVIHWESPHTPDSLRNCPRKDYRSSALI